jgi:hypothetical protein
VLLSIDDLLIDEVNEAKMSRNKVTVTEAVEVIAGARYKLFRNPRSADAGAPLIVVGPTAGGRFITMPIDPTYTDGLYRPRTAYDSGKRQLDAYRARR